MYDISWVRFGTSGTLILVHGIADWLWRRRATPAPMPPAPRWLRPAMLASILAFYSLIGPAGGELLGGAGNLAGVAAAVLATAIRPHGRVRYPEVTARCLFYLALPIAVGVPWGLLALSVPACATSIYRCRQADRALRAEPEAGLLPRHRMLPGLW